MRPDIYFKTDGSMEIGKHLKARWMVKSPTTVNARKGTCSLTYGDRVKLDRMEGILFIDKASKNWVLVPIKILNDCPPEIKSHQGVKDSLYVWNIKHLARDHRLEWTPIARLGESDMPGHFGMAGEVRSKFGL